MSGLKRILDFLYGLGASEKELSSNSSPVPEDIGAQEVSVPPPQEPLPPVVNPAPGDDLVSEADASSDEIDLASQMGDIVPLILELEKCNDEPEDEGDESSSGDVAPARELPPFSQRRAAVSLLKGGVGKTTITCFLATAIQKFWDDSGVEDRLLVVDTDPQGSATDFFLKGENVPPELSLRALFPPYADPSGALLFHHTRYPRIDILPAHTSMADVHPTAPGQCEGCLAWFLAEAASEYSLILIDTPPSDTLALRNALMAASGIFMPIDPSRQALKTLPQFSKTFSKYKKRNSELKVYGVVFSRYDTRLNLDRDIRKEVSALLKRSGLKLYEVPRRAALSACYNNYVGYEGLDPKKESDVAKVFTDMATHLLSV